MDLLSVMWHRYFKINFRLIVMSCFIFCLKTDVIEIVLAKIYEDLGEVVNIPNSYG